MTEPPRTTPSRTSQSGSAPSSPLRSPRPILFHRLPRESPPPPGPSQQPDAPVRETGLIAWIDSIRDELRRENDAFRENMLQENEIWKASLQRELREEVRRLVVEKFIADNKPISSSESSLSITEEPSTSQPRISPPLPGSTQSGEPSPVSPLMPSPTISTAEPPVSAPSSMPPPPPGLRHTGKTPQGAPSIPIRMQKALIGGPAPFILPRRPRLGSYYAAIVDTDGDDPEGTLLAHMIEIATHRPGFLFSHTGTPEPHRDCCATLFFATITNVHDWMHDVNYAYRLDSEEIERLQQNSGELKRKRRRIDAFVRICKVEAEDPWEIYGRRR